MTGRPYRLTWQSYGDMASTDVAVDVAGDVEIIDWLSVGELHCDMWHLLGRMEGCHVAPRNWISGLLTKILWRAAGFDPRTSPTIQAL
jgi:hypothetical protein